MRFLNFFVLILFSFIFNTKCFGQITIYQDIFKGGVTAAGYSIGAGTGQQIYTANLDVEIPPGSSIRRAIMVVSEDREEPQSIVFNLNGDNYTLNQSTKLVGYDITASGGNPYQISNHLIDVSNSIFVGQNSYLLSIPNQNAVADIYRSFYLIILFESPSAMNTSFNLFMNSIDVPNLIANWTFTEFPPYDIGYDIGLAINSDIICQIVNDGEYVFINDIPIGLIGGFDQSNVFMCAGVKAHFNYINGILIGLDDDIPNNSMNESDGLALINDFIGVNNDTFTIRFESQRSDYRIHNNPISFQLTYSTPCDTFSVSTPNDTTLCQGETLQLNATGGQSYEWLPATGLSCADCPNPVFTVDSSMFYTVRIWNNDTCSVVRPLKINVRPRPEFGNLTTTPSECGANTGTVTLNAFPNNGIVANWQEVGGATQTSNVFQNLSTGNHTFFFVDTNGCQSADTTVFVGEINSTSASFSVSPQSGAVPLTVQFTNTSQNATNFEWFVEGVSVGSSLQNWEFGNSGYPEISLVAWSNDPSCADTATQSVFVFDSLMIHIPNVFTPNYDGVNDFFEITNSLPVHCELVIVNRWGTIMYEFSDNLGAGSTKLWDGFSLLFHGDMIEGTYFYDVTFSGANEQTLELEKLGILPIKKSGFVEVRR